MYEQIQCGVPITNNKSFIIDGDWEYQLGPPFAQLPLDYQDQGSCPFDLLGAHLIIHVSFLIHTKLKMETADGKSPFNSRDLEKNKKELMVMVMVMVMLI